MASGGTTPLIAQYFEIKEKHPDSLLLFQVGDFYELFFDDAKAASSFLALALTKRGKHKGSDIPLCGVPVHSLNHYVVKLVRGGFKVAVCNQVEKPKPGTVVKRQVAHVYTPGTLTDAAMLDDKSASYLSIVCPVGQAYGLLFVDLLGSQIAATVVSSQNNRFLENELARFLPDEVVIHKDGPLKRFISQQGFYVSVCGNISDSNKLTGLPQRVIDNLENEPEIYSTILLLSAYLEQNNPSALSQITSMHFYVSEDFLLLDSATQKNLEIVKNSNDGGKSNTLMSVLDDARTAMGSRLIKKWLQRPLLKKESIENRFDVVEKLVSSPSTLFCLVDLLSRMSDIERIVGRIALNRAVFPDFISLKNSLQMLPQICEAASSLQSSLGAAIISRCRPMPELVKLLDMSLDEKGGATSPIKAGFNPELDRLRSLASDGHKSILDLEQREINATGISSLKIRYTDAFGYAIEITKTHYHLVPDHYVAKQTLVGRTRYVTDELKSLEAEILHARERLGEVQAAVFAYVKSEVSKYVRPLRELSQAVAMLDALSGFASVAYKHRYVRPAFNDDREIVITGGRHPIVERNVEKFTPNNTSLTDQESLWIVTGPNMGGKSTYLRQVALISIMAQAGSFVPASSASMPIIDRMFTRIGSGDNLAAGKSTFLVEMEEAALICRESTHKSLIILDEVGRGTSTFDGMAIAQAIIEFLFHEAGARTLFATHYHELTSLEKTTPGITNYSMACRKGENGLEFLHTLTKGPSEGSFGIQVAQLAGLPKSIIDRSELLLRNFSIKNKPD